MYFSGGLLASFTLTAGVYQTLKKNKTTNMAYSLKIDLK